MSIDREELKRRVAEDGPGLVDQIGRATDAVITESGFGVLFNDHRVASGRLLVSRTPLGSSPLRGTPSSHHCVTVLPQSAIGGHVNKGFQGDGAGFETLPQREHPNGDGTVVTMTSKEILALVMGHRFAASIMAVVVIQELCPASGDRLRSHLEMAGDPVDVDCGDGFWIGFQGRELAITAIDRWHDAGLIVRSDILDLWERNAEGAFVCTDPDR